MSIVKAERVEECLDRTLVYEYVLSAGVAESGALRMAAGGRLEVFRDFPRPLFRAFAPDGLRVQGILGDPGLRVIFPSADPDRKKGDFERLLLTL